MVFTSKQTKEQIKYTLENNNKKENIHIQTCLHQLIHIQGYT